MDADERSAVMVLRVWREGGTTDLRARITMTANADEPGGTETAAANEEEILSLVRSWLKEFAST
jgi:hypothetical protein